MPYVMLPILLFMAACGDTRLPVLAIPLSDDTSFGTDLNAPDPVLGITSPIRCTGCIEGRVMKPALFALALCLAACSSPRLNAGLSLGADGLSVSPSVSAGLGGGRISYSP